MRNYLRAKRLARRLRRTERREGRLLARLSRVESSHVRYVKDQLAQAERMLAAEKQKLAEAEARNRPLSLELEIAYDTLRQLQEHVATNTKLTLMYGRGAG